jgi:hypothetical protein
VDVPSSAEQTFIARYSRDSSEADDATVEVLALEGRCEFLPALAGSAACGLLERFWSGQPYGECRPIHVIPQNVARGNGGREEK